MVKNESAKPDKTNIRRIKAADGAPKTVTSTKKAASVSKKSSTGKIAKAKKSPRDINAPVRNPLVKLTNYVKGSWYELKQVRWPTRSATWSMTLAVLIFSGMFVVLILLLDLGFNYMFEQLLK